jgi:hypothetical protein
MRTCARMPTSTEISMAAKPNYNFDKRQRDIAKKKKQDEKRLKKQSKKNADGTDVADSADTATDANDAARQG